MGTQSIGSDEAKLSRDSVENRQGLLKWGLMLEANKFLSVRLKGHLLVCELFRVQQKIL